MKIYNTLTKSVEEFKPIDTKEIRMYSCGPTVYDRAHIGNLSAYIFADTLRRVLENQGYRVKHVMNYTDVDDKTIKRSQEKYPDLEPKEALRKLTDEYKELFLDDMQKVGVATDKIQFISAIDSIPAMQELIVKLVHEKIAYTTDDGVYFSIKAYKDKGRKYGQLLNISTENTSEARIDNDEYDKESVHDFALWKVQKPGEPAWNFEIEGKNLKGRPGWHIECSAMSEAALNLPFDIHTGGIDLIFPHHENEIAQSTAANSSIMANYFVHNNHILVDGRKMAKSAQNFYTLEDIVLKGFDPLAFRMLVLQSHYRNETNFTWESLQAAQNRLQNWQSFADRMWQVEQKESQFVERISTILDNDLASPETWALIDEAFVALGDSAPNSTLLELLTSLFGIKFISSDISENAKTLIQEREQARADKNWQRSDDLREELEKQGICVRDTDQGPIWYRV